MFKFVIERLKEPSTWRGLMWCAVGVLGAKWSPDTQATIISTGVGLAGVLGAALPDKFKL